MFRISLLKPIIDKLENLSRKEYASNTSDMRIIADHLRGAYLLAAQGLTPSNKQQGYAMRRLMRRAILKALNLGIEQNFLQAVSPIVAENYSSLPAEILTHRDDVTMVLEKEEKVFRQTLNRGIRELHKLKSHGLTGVELFKLQDTYGFPLELSVEEAYRQNIDLSKDWRMEFDAELAKQRERSQTASKGMFKGGLEDSGEQTVKYHTVAHLVLAAMQKLIDPSIDQKGANINSERLRFDFGLDRKLEPAEIAAIEKQVNEWIEADLLVSHAEYDKDYARDVLRAHGQFWERYPDKVTVYIIGDEKNPVSVEICGGPHVERLGALGKFKIVKEESSAAGVRRIKGVLE
jgi:alanyl-tRNA synthetase